MTRAINPRAPVVPRRPGRAGGFTLVEILVVIGIIVVLAGLMMSVVAASRERARSAQCASNLRQLGAAFLQYGADHDWMAPLYSSRWHLAPFWWHDPEALTQAVDPYIRDARVWFCPSDPYAGTDSVEWFVDHRFTSYIVSFSRSNPPPWPFPGTVDSEDWVVPGAARTMAWDANHLPIQGGQHRGRFNILYADGHVRSRSVYDTSES